MKTLTVQALIDFQWQDIATLTVVHPERGASSQVELEYHLDYSIKYLDKTDHHACGLTLPVQIMIQHESKHWFGFMDDIIPSGAARRYLIAFHGLQNLSNAERDMFLLEHGVIAPVGNLRIKESLPNFKPDSVLKKFELNEVVNRHTEFLEYAQQMGAISGGATGAGGEAPKLLIRLNQDNQVWIDTFQDDFEIPDQHYLVKFPRNNRSEIDCNILRAEYHYYHELHSLGVNTIAVDQMKLIEGDRYPSLWLPRFDVVRENGRYTRLGVESVYSVLGKPAGTHLNHFEVIDQLCKLLNQLTPGFKPADFVCEWLKRDLLNIVFGNSDNHGRNTSFIKSNQGISLAPIYDFAPMKADPEHVIRSTTWGVPFEVGGEYDWQAITKKLQPWCDQEVSMKALKDLALQLSGLKERLQLRGVPDQIIEMPVMGFNYTDAKLRKFGLL